MQSITKLISGFLFYFLTLQALFAQSNNDCSGAFEIVDPGNFCSPLNAGHNLFATPSNVPVPGCFSGAPHDVWYWFTAVAPNVVIVINGAGSTPGGTLLSPEVALYEGPCDALNLLGCEADPLFFGFGVIELRVENLIPGNRYFFRVDGATPGTFQFCVRNFFFDGGISGDCPTAIPLCDKSPFNVQAVVGPGADPFELDDAPCFGGTFSESNSTWYTFTAANNGTLEFRLTPNNAADDLDFIVYRLPNGMGNCNGKIIERCMTAGDTDPASPCMGPTGLNASSTDIDHGSGCLGENEDNFLRFMDVQAGNTYALVVNNFTSSGNGFQVDWGGTVVFTGPVAAIKTDDPDDNICLGDSIVFSDSSSFPQGIITDWGWTFGEGAAPSFATTSGPHTVTYQAPGQKLITMTIKTSLGCEVSTTRQILVEDCCPITLSVDVTPGCLDTPEATAALQVEGATPPLTYQWSDGQQDVVATGLAPGSYSVTIQDANDCTEIIGFIVPPPVDFTALFPADTVIITGTGATLSVISDNPALVAQWTGTGNSISGNPVTVQPAESTVYLVSASVGDCIITDTVRVAVRDQLFEVPNAFTPNADQMNDRFKPVLYAGTLVNLLIWSRWGELIYEGNSPEGWDGTFDGEAAPSDVYVYLLLIRLPNGMEEKRHGDVTLLR